METYNIGFIHSDGCNDETQLDVETNVNFTEELIDLFNLILSLKDEMDIKEITYIEQVFEEE